MPTELFKTDSILGSSSRESMQDSFMAYMQEQGLQFEEYANEMAELSPGETTPNPVMDVEKFAEKNPVNAEMDEQSKKLEGVTTDKIKEIRNPRNQAKQIDRTIESVGDDTCAEISAKVQALLKGEISPKEFAKALKGIGSGGVDSLLKDGLGIKDIKDLGKKAALTGALMVADRIGLDDQLEGLLNKIKSNKKKISEISNTKKRKDDATKDIFKKLPPVVRKILKGDPDALQAFIDEHCTEARKNMTQNAMGRAGLSGKVEQFVKNK